MQNGNVFQHCDSIYALRTGSTNINSVIIDQLDVKNYPNPFENSTNISYHLVGAAQMEIGIYNLLGERVMLIADQTQAEGQYQYRWDAAEFASGIYILRMVVNDHLITRKLSLVK